jgi:molecular chaperone GrpE
VAATPDDGNLDLTVAGGPGPGSPAAVEGTGDGRAGASDTQEETEAEAAQTITAELDQLVVERDELRDTTRRLQADFENYRKRVLREQSALVERATEGLVEQLLPVLDALELATASTRAGEPDPEMLTRGVELTHSELLGVLSKAGLERVGGVGAPFDPSQHEAVAQDDGDGDPVVAEVLRAGWKLKGRVLRPAMVKVAHHSLGDG